MRFSRTPLGSFTLVEVLVAAAITSLIVALLGGMLASMSGTASHASQRTDAFRDARAALQIMQRDLAGIIAVIPSPKTKATDPDPPRLAAYFVLDNRWQDTAADPYSDPANGTYNQQVFAIVAAENRPTGNPIHVAGDICAVGYYCRWEGTHYSLRRYFRDSYELMANGSYFVSKNPPRQIPPWNIPQYGPSAYIPSSKLFQPSNIDAPSANPPTFEDEIVAPYVWNLRITAYDGYGTIISQYPYVCDPAGSIGFNKPAVIEISFSAMSAQAARTVVSASNNPRDWMDSARQINKVLVAPHAYEFRTRLKL